jgi:hypothetical protein
MVGPGVFLALVAALVVAGVSLLNGQHQPAVADRSVPAVRLDALNWVAQRIYDAQGGGKGARQATRRISADPRLRAALAAHDRRALRSEVTRQYLRSPGLVRVAVSSGALSAEAGEPFVVAPARRVFRLPDGRRVVVRAATQDVLGYLRQVRRATEVSVVARGASGHVATPEPELRTLRLPDSGNVVAQGLGRIVRSFTVPGWNGEKVKVWLLGSA